MPRTKSYQAKLSPAPCTAAMKAAILRTVAPGNENGLETEVDFIRLGVSKLLRELGVDLPSEDEAMKILADIGKLKPALLKGGDA